MGYTPVQIRPGVNIQETELLNEGSWSSCNLIRFKDRMLEKLGGWTKMTAAALEGVCRGMFAWEDLSSNVYIAFGTSERLEIFYLGTLYDITPIVKTTNPFLPFTVNLGSGTVGVNDPNHGASVGDWINVFTETSVFAGILYGLYRITAVIDNDNYEIATTLNPAFTSGFLGQTADFLTTNASTTIRAILITHGLSVGSIFNINVPTIVGGLTLSGQVVVTVIENANIFDFEWPFPATSNDSLYENGGDPRLQYLLAAGLEIPNALPGYGSGLYGYGTYSDNFLGTQPPLRQWTMGNWGSQLIASPTNAAIYVWDPTNGVLMNPATIIATAPLYQTAIFIAMAQQQIVSLGAEVAGTQDPLLIRWCEVADYTIWTASSVNQAGSFRLSRGSKIIGGLQMPQQGLIWTDVGLWVMQYIQPPLVYGFTEIAQGCGLISTRAAGILGTEVYWMSQRGFFVFDGASVRPLECTVWDKVFRYVNEIIVLRGGYQDMIFAAPNSQFNEMTWYIVDEIGSGGITHINGYVKYNRVDKTWDYGDLQRTAWIDQSVFGAPIGVDNDGLIYQHEIAFDAAGEVMDSWAQTGWFKISGGEEFILLERLIPDFKFDNSVSTVPQVLITVFFADYPGDTPRQKGPYTVTPTTKFIVVRGRGRLCSIKVQGQTNDTGSFFRMGQPLYSQKPAGRR